MPETRSKVNAGPRERRTPPTLKSSSALTRTGLLLKILAQVPYKKALLAHSERIKGLFRLRGSKGTQKKGLRTTPVLPDGNALLRLYGTITGTHLSVTGGHKKKANIPVTGKWGSYDRRG